MDGYDLCDCWTTYRATESDLKRMEEEAAFLELLRVENRDERRDNLRRQEVRNISLRARGDNHINANDKAFPFRRRLFAEERSELYRLCMVRYWNNPRKVYVRQEEEAEKKEPQCLPIV